LPLTYYRNEKQNPASENLKPEPHRPFNYLGAYRKMNLSANHTYMQIARMLHICRAALSILAGEPMLHVELAPQGSFHRILISPLHIGSLFIRTNSATEIGFGT